MSWQYISCPMKSCDTFQSSSHERTLDWHHKSMNLMNDEQIFDSYLTLSRHTDRWAVLTAWRSIDDIIRLTDVKAETDGTTVKLTAVFTITCNTWRSLTSQLLSRVIVDRRDSDEKCLWWDLCEVMWSEKSDRQHIHTDFISSDL